MRKLWINYQREYYTSMTVIGYAILVSCNMVTWRYSVSTASHTTSTLPLGPLPIPCSWQTTDLVLVIYSLRYISSTVLILIKMRRRWGVARRHQFKFRLALINKRSKARLDFKPLFHDHPSESGRGLLPWSIFHSSLIHSFKILHILHYV